jgi:hypothetical protein
MLNPPNAEGKSLWVPMEEPVGLAQSSEGPIQRPEVPWDLGELTWLGGRSHPSHHSNVQQAQGAQTSEALEVA